MDITVRQAKREDAQQMVRVYENFARSFVGPASRMVKSFNRILSRKDNLNWVAVDSRNRIVGYVYTRLDKRVNRGEFREIVVDPEHDVEGVARLMVEKAVAAFVERKVSSIEAGSLRNPVYERLFPKLGFFESESNDVFMYAIIDVPKFLSEVSEVIINRLKQFESWDGLAQIECEGGSLFLEKSGAEVRQIVWTNQPVVFKVALTREPLIELLFGLVDPLESLRTGQLKVETTEGHVKADRLLRALFPRKQFLIMDHW